MADFYLLGGYIFAGIVLAVFVSRAIGSKLAGALAAVMLFSLLANITAAVCGSQCWPEKRATQAAKGDDK